MAPAGAFRSPCRIGTTLMARSISTKSTATPLGAAGWIRGVANPNPVGPPGEHLIGAGPRHFIDCLVEGASPVLTADHAIHVLDIILSAQIASEAGASVELATTFSCRPQLRM